MSLLSDSHITYLKTLAQNRLNMLLQRNRPAQPSFLIIGDNSLSFKVHTRYLSYSFNEPKKCIGSCNKEWR